MDLYAGGPGYSGVYPVLAEFILRSKPVFCVGLIFCIAPFLLWCRKIGTNWREEHENTCFCALEITVWQMRL